MLPATTGRLFVLKYKTAGVYFPACASPERGTQILDSKRDLESGNCTPPEYLLVALPFFKLFKTHPAPNLSHKHSL